MKQTVKKIVALVIVILIFLLETGFIYKEENAGFTIREDKIFEAQHYYFLGLHDNIYQKMNGEDKARFKQYHSSDKDYWFLRNSFINKVEAPYYIGEEKKPVTALELLNDLKKLSYKNDSVQQLVDIDIRKIDNTNDFELVFNLMEPSDEYDKYLSVIDKNISGVDISKYLFVPYKGNLENYKYIFNFSFFNFKSLRQYYIEEIDTNRDFITLNNTGFLTIKLDVGNILTHTKKRQFKFILKEDTTKSKENVKKQNKRIEESKKREKQIEELLSSVKNENDKNKIRTLINSNIISVNSNTKNLRLNDLINKDEYYALLFKAFNYNFEISKDKYWAYDIIKYLSNRKIIDTIQNITHENYSKPITYSEILNSYYNLFFYIKDEYRDEFAYQVAYGVSKKMLSENVEERDFKYLKDDRYRKISKFLKISDYDGSKELTRLEAFLLIYQIRNNWEKE